jgi:arylsulfatase
MKDGKPTYTYNFLGLQRFTVPATSALPAGKTTIRYEFASDGPGMGKGGIGTILVNGQKVAEGRIERTQCCFFSADEGADVGMDEGTPVTEDYKEGNNKFTGKIYSVTIDTKEMKGASAEVEQQVVHEAHVLKQLAD